MPPPPPNSRLDTAPALLGVQYPGEMIGVGAGHIPFFNDLLFNGTFMFGRLGLPFPMLEDEVI